MKPHEAEVAVHVIFINSLDLCSQIAFQGWWQRCQLRSSVVSHLCLFLQTLAQAKPKPPLLAFSLPRHPVTGHPFSQEPWLVKAWLKHCCVCWHLLFLKSPEQPSIYCVNRYCVATQSPLPFIGSVGACKFHLPFLKEKQQGGSGSMTTNSDNLV